MRIADRMANLDASGIRKVFDLAAELDNPVNLSIGQPDFDVPDECKEAAVSAIRAGLNRYTPTQGITELRGRILRKLNEEKGVSEVDQVIITSGVSGALILAFLVLINPGDEVVIPDPYFVMYKHLVSLTGGVPVYVDTYPDFVVTADRLREAVTDRTRLVLLNNPANPTGTVIPADEIDRIVELAREKDLLLFSDEIYDGFVYDMEYRSPAAGWAKTLLAGGFSKSHAMTGWRLGYLAGPAPILEKVAMLQQYSFVCAPSFAQYAGVRALDVDTSEYREKYRAKRDRIYEGLVDAGYEVSKPEGAFYVFPKCPWGTDDTFVTEAIRNNLLIIPGSVFSERNTHFRIAYAAPDSVLDEGVEILARLKEQGGPKEG